VNGPRAIASPEPRPQTLSPLRVVAHGASDAGMVRDENQDSFTVLELPPDSEPGGWLLAIADGMGGLAGGATASRLAIEAIRDGYPRLALEPAAALKAAVHRANFVIRTHVEDLPGQEPMGSTLTALAISGGTAWVAHVGDSRAYRIPSEGPIVRITRDHTWVEELARRGELDPDSIQYSLHRSILTRALGLRAEVEVDVVEVENLSPGDCFIICSDGLHEMVEDVEIEARARARGSDVGALAGELVRLARDRGAPDNVTVIAARIEDSPAGPPPGPFGGEEEPVRPVKLPDGPGLFPRAALVLLGWLGAFGLGVGSVLLLEEPPAPASPPLDQVLRDPAYHAIFETPEGQRVREALRGRIQIPEARE
jgi:PPM family protein phosphatase